MSLRTAFACLCLLCICVLRAQLPPSGKLSANDDREFHKELERLGTLLATSNDKGAVQLQIANTYVAGGQYQEAFRLLRKVVHDDLGFDPSRDPDFTKLQGVAEFRSIMDEVRSQTRPVLNSRLIATIDKPDLFPENIAVDPNGNTFFIGSTAKEEITKCVRGSTCVSLVKPSREEQGYVLGLKIDKFSNAIWATMNNSTGASVRRYDIATGRLTQSAGIDGKHVFNDLALSSAGFVYVSDTREGSVYELNVQNNILHRIAPKYRFTSANGIALSPDEKLLYVSAWADGIDVVDLRSGSVEPVRHPDNIGLAFIDGLYAINEKLIAIQNGPMSPRIVEFRLDKSRREIAALRVLERRNPLFDGLTTGALVGDKLYYVANPQIDHKTGSKLQALKILAVGVR